MVDLKLDWCSYQAAKYACENWHYSKSIPVPPLNTIGVWEDSKFIGSIIFSRGTSSTMFNQFNLTISEGCELSRVALSSHETEVSRMISIALKLLKRRNPKLRIVVSYADKNRGHIGAIYKAGGWIYVGETSPSFYYINDKCVKIHSRMVSSTGINRQFGAIRKTYKSCDLTKKKEDGKYKYLFPLDSIIKKQILSLSKPYPKRGKQATSRDHLDGGGAEPTPTLHLMRNYDKN